MRHDQNRVSVAFSMGDPHGIGPEVLLKALAEGTKNLPIRPLVFGDEEFLQRLQGDLGLVGALQGSTVISCGTYPYPPAWGTLSAEAGRFAARSLKSAAEHCRDHQVPLLVTAPLNKQAARLGAGFPAGQTEYLASIFPGQRPVMAFFSDRMHVLLATVHIPLRQVADQLNESELTRRTLLFHQALQRLGKRPDASRPRIAVCGLNPHASEGGLFGDEEERIVIPSIAESNRRLGHGSVEGPFPADTLFRRVLKGEFDGVVALYHDQGLIPLKLLAFDRAVNVSLGLPIVRTSPDHGTAFDIAGKGRADPSSMLAAVQWGLRLLPRGQWASQGQPSQGTSQTGIA